MADGLPSYRPASTEARASARVTIVVTTSPIPSHPSPILLRTLFASFHDHLVGLGDCHRVLVCDGYVRDDGGSQLCSPEDYEGFLRQVEELQGTGEFGDCQVLRLDSCHGYGLALAAALELVATEFVLVVQHDWLFVRSVDLASAVMAMDSDADIKYLGLQSITTLDYPKRMRVRYGLELPPTKHVGGLSLVPQLLWYDKPHLCRVAHYKDVVLRAAPPGRRECPERRYGVQLMWPVLLAAEDLQEEHRRFGTYFWDTGAEVIYHLSGRKLKADTCSKDTLAPLAALEVHGAVCGSTTFTAAAAERTVVIPGLALPTPGPDASRFKGRCYICGEKGHSKLRCSKRQDLEPSPPHVLAGC